MQRVGRSANVFAPGHHWCPCATAGGIQALRNFGSARVSNAGSGSTHIPSTNAARKPPTPDLGPRRRWTSSFRADPIDRHQLLGVLTRPWPADGRDSGAFGVLQCKAVAPSASWSPRDRLPRTRDRSGAAHCARPSVGVASGASVRLRPPTPRRWPAAAPPGMAPLSCRASSPHSTPRRPAFRDEAVAEGAPVRSLSAPLAEQTMGGTVSHGSGSPRTIGGRGLARVEGELSRVVIADGT